MRYRDMGPGWVFIPLFIILLITILFVLSGRADALEAPPCPDPARPVHYMPFCLTEAEYQALLTPKPVSVAPATSYAPQMGVEQWRGMVNYYWGRHGGWVVDRMLQIMACETVPDGNPRSLNPSSGAAGLFQIMPQWKRVWGGDYFDPWVNAATAYQIWLAQGWGAWSQCL